MLQNIRDFLASLTAQGRAVVAITVVAVVALLILAAMWFGYDLAWLPALLGGLVGQGG